MSIVGVPRLAPHVRLRFDASRDRHVLLGPESVVVLNPTGAEIVRLCDGRGVAEIVAALRERYDHVEEPEVRTFLLRMAERGCLEVQDG